MKFNKNKVALGLAFLQLLAPSYNHAANIYTIKKGDYLSQILAQKNLRPIYGKNGTLILTLQLNPNLQNQKGNLIFPQQLIQLPADHQNSPEPEQLTSTPAETPSSATDEPLSTQPQLTFDMYGGFGLNYFTVAGIDKITQKEALTISNLSSKVMVGLKMNWLTYWLFDFSGTLNQYSFRDLETPKSFDSNQGSRYSLNLGLSYMIKPDLQFGLELVQSENFFFYSQSANIIKMDKVAITGLNLTGQYKWASIFQSDIGAKAQYGFLPARSTSNYSIESGTHGRLGLFAQHETGFEAETYYQFIHQDSSISTQKYNEIGLQIIYNWRL